MHEYICCVENNLLGTSDSTNNTKGKSSGGGFGLWDLLERMTSDEQVEKPDVWWCREESDAPMKEDIFFLQKSRRYNGEGNGIPLQYSCLENPVDRGAW